MTDIAVIHQLHCLNVIRKATYYDYYKDKAIEFTDKPETVRLHIGEFFPLLPYPSTRPTRFYVPERIVG